MSQLLQPDRSVKGPHPDADQLNAFVEHTLPEHEHQETLVHLADCAACRNIVALSLPPREETTIVRPAEPPPSRFADWFAGLKLAPTRLWFAAPALAALVCLVFYFQFRGHDRKPIAPPGQVAAMHAPSTGAVVPVPPNPESVPPPVPQTAAAPSAPKLPEARNDATAASGKHLPLQDRSVSVAKLPPPARTAVSPATSRGIVAGTGSGVGTTPGNGVGTVQHAKPSGDALGSLNRPLPQRAASSHATPAPKRQAELPNQVDAVASIQAALPSGEPVLSVAANLSQRLAIDTGYRLFFSEDSGRHWRSVASPWRGRAISVSRIAQGGGRPQVPTQAVAFAVPERYSPGENAVAEADTSSNSLSGSISSASGAVIAHAKVLLTDSRTGLVRTVETDGSGRYAVANFVPGLYRIDVRVPGFQNQSLLVDLSSALRAVRNITLHVGQGSETVAAEASNAPFDTDSGLTSDSYSKSSRLSASSQGTQLPHPALFVVTTDTGDRWTSSDGQHWKPE